MSFLVADFAKARAALPDAAKPAGPAVRSNSFVSHHVLFDLKFTRIFAFAELSR
jgi:hypothetical protein